MANFSEKGQFAFELALKYFKTGSFSAKELSEVSGEKIAAATLTGIVNKGYMTKEAGTPVKYRFVDDIDELLAMDSEDGKKGCDKTHLEQAKAAKKNEFYTMVTDVEMECSKYRQQFRGKRIFCNCNDGEEHSAFWDYFRKNFDAFGLDRLTAISYKEKNGCGVKREIRTETFVDEDTFTTTILTGDGGFESEESLAVLDECDIVITNPPFSEFRAFVSLLLKSGKKFLIIGNNNAVSYKEIFTPIKNEEMRLGYSANKTMTFMMPMSYEGELTDEGKMKTGKVPAISWFTNLTTKKMEEPIILTATYDNDTNRRENYEKYDSYDAINVDRVENIPKDYDGVMGVPITYLGKHCPSQFEIIGLMASTTKDEINFGYPYINGVKKYARVLIKRKSMDESYLY